MIFFRRWLVVLTVAASRTALAQAAPATVRAAAVEIMKAARYCTLVTIGADGQPQARIVDPLLVDGQTSIWIATNPLSRKVAEIKHDARVTLLFFNTKANEYVTVIGRAAVVTDASQKARHWKADWAPFYKKQSRGEDFMLFEVRPSQLEVVSPGRGIMNDSTNWKPRIVRVP